MCKPPYSTQQAERQTDKRNEANSLFSQLVKCT